MQTRSKFALFGVIAAIPLFALAGVAVADPSDLFVPQVPPHRHFIQTPTGERVPVGPQICERPELRKAFEQFHFNIHHSFIPVSARSTRSAPRTVPRGCTTVPVPRSRPLVDGDVEGREGGASAAPPSFHAESFE